MLERYYPRDQDPCSEPGVLYLLLHYLWPQRLNGDAVQSADYLSKLIFFVLDFITGPFGLLIALGGISLGLISYVFAVFSYHFGSPHARTWGWRAALGLLIGMTFFVLEYSLWGGSVCCFME